MKRERPEKTTWRRTFTDEIKKVGKTRKEVIFLAVKRVRWRSGRFIT